MTQEDNPLKSIELKAKSLADGVAARLGAEVNFLNIDDMPWLNGIDSLTGLTARLYGVQGGSLAVIKPCGVASLALYIKKSPDAAALDALEAELSENEALLSELLGVYPDMFLSERDGEVNVCCLYCAYQNDDDKPRMTLFYRLLERFPVISFYRLEEADVFLITSSMENTYELTRDILPLTRSCGAKAGFCGPYERAPSARGCYKKARLAAFAAKDAFEFFSDCRYDEFWREAAAIAKREGFYARDFCGDALWRMKMCDLSSSSSYVDSLRAYLDSGRNLRVSSDMLNIHRNTMAYRIKKIGELFSFDPDDDAMCFEAQFSLRILDFLEPSPSFDGSRFFAPSAERNMWDAIMGRKPKSSDTAMAKLLIIDLDGKDDRERDEILTDLRRKSPNCALAFDDEAIYMSFSADDDVFEDILSSQKALRCALSQEFPLCLIRERMRLMKRFLIHIRSYGELAGVIKTDGFSSALFLLFLQEHMDLTPFCCDEVIRVMDYDFVRNTSLSKSLYAYLTHYTDLKGAAREARVHRNTLDYQIKKVLSVLGGEPVDGRLRFEMMCTYRILSTVGYTDDRL